MVELTSGARIGRFVVTRQLGEGGMGTVVEARDPELGRAVALKLMRDDGGDTMRLLREAQALATISHPNVVTVYELGTHEHQVFIAMELVDGVSLDRVLAEQRRPWREVLGFFVEAGRGLAAVHDRGMVHRDFKPSNVMVDRAGRVRVGDFGLAALDAGGRTPATARRGESEPATDGAEPVTDETADADAIDSRAPDDDAEGRALGALLTRTGAVLGTPRYMAPEQHEGARVTHKADQFAFCVALWESLHGVHPFPLDSRDNLRAAVLAGRRAPVPSGTGVPGWLARTIERGLSRDPEARWPSMSALVDELVRTPRRRRLVASLAAGAVVMGGAVAAAVLITGGGGAARVDCARAAASMDATWGDAQRTALRARLSTLGGAWAGEATTNALGGVDAWASRWRDVRIDACRAANERGEHSAALLDQRSACLDRQRVGLDALIAALGTADRATAANAFTAVSSLPPPESCSNARLSGIVASARNADVERAIADARAATQLRTPNARDLAERAVTDADRTGDAALRSAARVVRGEVVSSTDVTSARADFEEAHTLAARAGDPVLEADALFASMTDASNSGSFDRVDALVPSLRAAVARAGDPPALVYKLAKAEMFAGYRSGSFERFDAACARLQPAAPAEDKELTRALCDCIAGVMKRDLDVSLPACGRTLDITRARYGDSHPDTLNRGHNQANALMQAARLDEAHALELANLEQVRAVYGDDSIESLRRLETLAIIEKRQKRFPEARARLEAALAMIDRVKGASRQRYSLTYELADVYWELDDHANAVKYAELALTESEQALGPEHPELVGAFILHGKILGSDPSLRERSRASFERAVKLAETKSGAQSYRYANTTHTYAVFLKRWGEYQTALAMIDRALPALEELGLASEIADAKELRGEILAGMRAKKR